MKQLVDIFTGSQLSTEILDFGNMEEEEEEGSSSSSYNIQLGSSPAIDRYNPIIRDPRRLAGSNNPSCSSPPLLSPTPPPNHQKQTTTTTYNNSFASKIINKKKQQKEKPTAKPVSDDGGGANKSDFSIMNGRRSWSCMNMKPGGFISPPGSSRYLLSEKTFLNVYSSDFDPVMKIVPPETSNTHAVRKHESVGASMQSASSARATEQVVVLRVSLHCRGCERKMRKHLSRMEGVSSFNIDFAAKKVTVVGNVTPLEVLANILKVKNAQLWTPPTPTNFDEMKKPAESKLI